VKVIVTGAAGFIGSHLCASLLDAGDEVVGIDSLTDNYSPSRKEANVAPLMNRQGFTLHRLDLLTAPLVSLFRSVDVVYHLAGQSGTRASWGAEFVPCMQRNVLATQRVLEAAADGSLWKVVHASCSSVYGNAETYPTPEDARTRPVSPYGVTKLAADHLCESYRAAGVRTVSLRLFTVYGPRQRPDMAFARLTDAALSGEPFLLYGDGEQSRDFTHVDDVVNAAHLAALSPWTGVANIGSGSPSTMNRAITLVSALARPVYVVNLPVQRGDVRHTAADTTVARQAFGYTPSVALEDGLSRMVAAAASSVLPEI
jgi:nucleoside-diphosphate-sugar epimerase